MRELFLKRDSLFWMMLLRRYQQSQSSGVLNTVTGTAPLTLENALPKAIKSLIQYGKCAQSGTPSSANPVDIVCNNGTMTIVDDELPIGYRRITGIKFDGGFWYETGEYLTGEDDVTLTLANTSTTGQNVFGSYSGTSSGIKNFSLYLYGGGSSSNCYLRYGEQLVRPRYGSNERTLTFGKSGTSGFTTNVSITPDTFTTNSTAYIGMLPNSTSPAYTGSIIGNIYVSDRLKYVPCERQSDGAIGYYETFTGVFLEQTGTGTPTKGEYDNSSVHIEVIGTNETLSVTGKNLLNVATNTTGYYISATGVITADTQTLNSQYSNLIKVKSGEKYTWSLVSNRATAGNNRIHGYNASGEWVRQVDFSQAAAGAAYTLTVTIPSGVSYVRLSYGINDTNAMLENGSVKTEYEEFTVQSASVESLLGVGEYRDEQNLISGVLTRRCSAVVYDGTQTIGNTYMSTTGGKDAGAIIVYPLDESVIERVIAQPLTTSLGENTVDVNAEVNDVLLEVKYTEQAQ